MNQTQEKLQERLKRAREYNAERNRGLSAAGRCIGCAEPFQPERAGRKRCPACVEKNRLSQAGRRARHRAAGRCTQCARPMPEVAGVSAKCPDCTDKARKTAIERNRKHRDRESRRIVLTSGADGCLLRPEDPASGLRLSIESGEIVARQETGETVRYRTSTRIQMAVRRAGRDRQSPPVIIILSREKKEAAGRAYRLRPGSQWEKEQR